jgi:hypothetical protein
MRGRWRRGHARKYVKGRVHGHECEKTILRAAPAGNNHAPRHLFPASREPGRDRPSGRQNKFEDSAKISLKNFKGAPIVKVSVPGNFRGRAGVRVPARVARSGLLTISC